LNQDDCFNAAFSLVIYKEGSVTDWDVDDLLERYLKKQKIVVDKTLFLQELSKAAKHYKSSIRSLFVCSEISCRKKSYLGLEEASLKLLAQNLLCEVETTGCHWICESAPVLKLKIGQSIETYINCSTEKSVSNAISEMKNRLKENPLPPKPEFE
jgi:hypothetical protein